MLFTGDLQDEGEKKLISNQTLTDCDILKIAHHGSKASTSKKFLEIIKPEFSVISCGENNSYGHPHFELLERLEDVGSDVVITAQSGAISINTDGFGYTINKFLDREEAKE